MKFDQYSRSELEQCGAELVKHFRLLHGRDLSDEGWTEFVLDFFAGAARPGLLVDARPPRGDRPWSAVYPAKIAGRKAWGEFMLDLTHSSYPDYSTGYANDAYWDKALSSECKVYLALESEWGKAGAPTATRAAVLHDAIKLPAVNAQVKVMVFGSEDSQRAERLRDDLTLLRTRSGDAAPWLLVSVPWKSADSAWWVVA